MKIATLVMLLLLGLLHVQAPAWAATPTETVRQATDQVIQVLDDPALPEEKKRAAVKTIALDVLDVAETATLTLGRHWHQRTPAEREEFVQIFVELLDRTYVRRIERYTGERVRFRSETIDGDHAIVEALILTTKRLEIPIEVMLRRRGDRWRVYDIGAAGMRLVAYYRTQFDRAIRAFSYSGLVTRLKKYSVEDQAREIPCRRDRSAPRADPPEGP